MRSEYVETKASGSLHSVNQQRNSVVEGPGSPTPTTYLEPRLRGVCASADPAAVFDA